MSTSPPAHAQSGPAAPIDLDHLHQQTLGDRNLQAELLDLFARQAERIMADLAATGPAVPSRQRRADLLHTLCGSARAVGAWDVAAGAETLEHQERRDAAVAAGLHDQLAALDVSVMAACAAVEALRRSEG